MFAPEAPTTPTLSRKSSIVKGPTNGSGSPVTTSQKASPREERKLSGSVPKDPLEESCTLIAQDKDNSFLFGCLNYLLRFARCSVSAYAVAIIYIRKIVKHNQKCQALASHQHTINVNLRSIWRLFVVCTVIAAKYLDDRVHTNEYYAAIANVEPSEINTMEIQVLRALHFKAWVGVNEYKKIERELALAALGNNSRQKEAEIVQGALFPQFTRPPKADASSSTHLS